MNTRYLPAVVLSPAVFALFISGWVGGEPTTDSTYIDPHLVILLFLFGFSLLYAVLLILDVATQKHATDRAPEE